MNFLFENSLNYQLQRGYLWRYVETIFFLS